MRTASWLAAAVAILLVSAPGLRADDLVLSLHPLAAEGETVTEPALAGRWVLHDWLFLALTFEEQKDGSYLVTVSDGDEKANENCSPDVEGCQETERCEDKKKPIVFRGHLVRVREFLFLEITPEGQMHELDFRIPAYWLLRIRIEADQLILEPLSDTWLRDMLEQGRVDMPYERINDALLLLGSPQELEKLLELYGWDPAAF